jgi:hypothetical protein
MEINDLGMAVATLRYPARKRGLAFTTTFCAFTSPKSAGNYLELSWKSTTCVCSNVPGFAFGFRREIRLGGPFPCRRCAVNFNFGQIWSNLVKMTGARPLLPLPLQTLKEQARERHTNIA